MMISENMTRQTTDIVITKLDERFAEVPLGFYVTSAESPYKDFQYAICTGPYENLQAARQVARDMGQRQFNAGRKYPTRFRAALFMVFDS